MKDYGYYVRRKYLIDVVTLIGFYALYWFIARAVQGQLFIGITGAVLAFILLVYLGEAFLRLQWGFKVDVVKDELDRHYSNIKYYPIRQLKDREPTRKDFTRKRREGRNGLSSSEVMACGFIAEGNIIESKNYIEGTVLGVSFISSDFKSATHHPSSRGHHYKTHFRGRVFIFELEKIVERPVFILEKFKPLNDYNYQVIKTSNSQFDRTFTVYAERNAEAKSLLTPSMMESLLKLEREYPGKFGLSLMHNKLYVALHTRRPLLSFRYFIPVTRRIFSRIKREFALIYDVANALKLSNQMNVAHNITFTDQIEPDMPSLQSVIQAMSFELIPNRNNKHTKTLTHTPLSEQYYHKITHQKSDAEKRAIDKDLNKRIKKRLERTTNEGVILDKKPVNQGKILLYIWLGMIVFSFLVMLIDALISWLSQPTY